jgi:hypothetical protein
MLAFASSVLDIPGHCSIFVGVLLLISTKDTPILKSNDARFPLTRKLINSQNSKRKPSICTVTPIRSECITVNIFTTVFTKLGCSYWFATTFTRSKNLDSRVWAIWRAPITIREPVFVGNFLVPTLRTLTGKRVIFSHVMLYQPFPLIPFCFTEMGRYNQLSVRGLGKHTCNVACTVLYHIADIFLFDSYLCFLFSR